MMKYLFYVASFLPAGSMAEQERKRWMRWSRMEVWAAATSSGASDLHNTQYISQNLIYIQDTDTHVNRGWEMLSREETWLPGPRWRWWWAPGRWQWSWPGSGSSSASPPPGPPAGAEPQPWCPWAVPTRSVTWGRRPMPSSLPRFLKKQNKSYYCTIGPMRNSCELLIAK